MGWAFRGKWLVGHVIVVLIAAVFIRLGIWQLDRLHQRREHNRVIEARMKAATVSIDALPRDVDAARYRRVTLSGTYDASHQRVVRFRSNDGDPGTWLTTPLRTDDGHVVAVIRGWMPDGATDAVKEPPAGDVMLTGLVDQPKLGHPDAFTVDDVAGRSGDVFPAFVQLTSQTPAPRTGLPKPLDPPDLGEGPHFSYAMQWFGFTLVGLIGWPLLIRREAQRRRTRREKLRRAQRSAPSSGGGGGQ
jgi:cytochrome oxidase assembly protein ShyY1